MSLTRSLSTSVRSATYNPEAEKALQEERAKANKAKSEIRAKLREFSASLSDWQGKNPNAPQQLLKPMKDSLGEEEAFLTANPELTEQEYKDRFQQFVEKWAKNYGRLDYVTKLVQAETVYSLGIRDALSKNQLTSSKQKELEAKLQELKDYIAKTDKKELEEIRPFAETWTKDYLELVKKTGVDASSPQAKNPKEMEQQIKAREEAENKKFSFKRFFSRVTGTATTVVNALLYVTFALVMAMLAANDAIGREPMYRVLYFFYGFIFAPFLAFYYLYRWYKGTAPKIYTLLPYSQTPAETSLGRFFKFPFYWKEDKPARDLMVQFLTQSAEAVGKTFDPTSLGSLGQQVEKVAENLKNLTQEAVQQTAEATTAAQTAAQTAYPNVSKLQVNK